MKEGFEQSENLSEKQQEMLNAFSKEVLPLIIQLKQTNDSSFSEQIFEATRDFKDALKKEDIFIPDNQIEKVIQDLYNVQEAA